MLGVDTTKVRDLQTKHKLHQTYAKLAPIADSTDFPTVLELFHSSYNKPGNHLSSI